ncbi:DUF6168 family protein [Cognatitamlana onchidii]|uniref:DUF6168 family protein n=1 Tax=Cognatitamlana onchidii TaxID=2562860 RepID=UPI0010A635EC|nr:DUF6168 family protein [Algibacter onchidii]
MIFNKLLESCLVVILVAAVSFAVHYVINFFLESVVTLNQLLYSYSINMLLACGVISIIFLLKKKLKDQLGFVFMLASMLKFVFFFILLYPEYNADGLLSRMEFLTFFIPYAICLITESVILSKFLNSLDNYK